MSAAAGGPVAVHQFIATLNPHDATGTHALQLRDALRAAGWRSEIFAEAIHDDLAAEAFKHWMYPEHAAPGDVAIYQFTTSSAVAGYLAEHGLPLILDFHNFTGPEYFAGWEPQSVQRAAAAADELALLAPRALLGLAKSPFSQRGAPAGGLPAHRGRPGPGRLPAASPPPRTPGWRPSWPGSGRTVAPTSSSSGGSCPPRPSTSWSRRCGPTAGSTTRRPACTWSVARRASSTPRPCRTSCTTSACPPRCACPARCRTRRWRPTSGPPTSTSRCRPTRGSGSRWSRRWWPACPSSPAAPVRCPTRWPTPRWCWPPPTPPTSPRPCTGCCTDERLRATLTAAGTPSRRRALRRTPWPPAPSRPSPRWWGRP